MTGALTIGILSGTSADGIDVAVVDWRKKPSILASATFPYRAPTRRLISRFRGLHTEEVARLHRAIGDDFSDAVLKLLSRRRIAAHRISVIGSHGQTVFHIPRVMSLQLGAPAVIAERTGIPVAADFRVDDIASGGEGAPLVPVLDQFLLRERSRRSRNPIATLNIGGIANITVLSRGKVTSAYDIGPGNCLLDRAAGRLLGRRMDRGGGIAATGTVLPRLLRLLLAHPFMKRPVPRSTGVEEFGDEYLERVLSRRAAKSASSRDILATLAEAAAVSIAGELASRRVVEVWISGGGVHNVHLMNRIQSLAPGIRCHDTAHLGIDPDYKEAVLFALLGLCRIEERPLDLRRITGSRRPRILGGLWLP